MHHPPTPNITIPVSYYIPWSSPCLETSTYRPTTAVLLYFQPWNVLESLCAALSPDPGYSHTALTRFANVQHDKVC